MPQILIVEDDPNDAFFIERAFKAGGARRTPHICDNVADAIRYIEGTGQYADRERFPFPNVLVTDLKMPAQGGLELLRWLRQHPQFRIIPTIVFSSSALNDDVQCAYCLGANAYIQKPSDQAAFRDIFVRLLRFWESCAIPQANSCCGKFTPAQVPVHGPS